jgi:hypothetical protein
MRRQPGDTVSRRCGGFLARGSRMLLAALVLAALCVAAARYGGMRALAAPATQAPSAASASPPAQFDAVIHVPGDAPTIQAAVDMARPGDLVLVAPGVYHEAVKVHTPGITIRGEDRNATILDGQSRLPNGFTVVADNVVIENMTAHHYVGNGFFWTAQTGYRGSYLTAYDNGDYGIYAFGSTLGQFDHDYASGSPDSGFYIGQCFPCDALITHVTSEWNALGYSGTNAGGNLIIRDSEWAHNGAGIVPNTLDTEKMPPEHGTTILHNYVHDNGNPDTPSFALERPGQGAGIEVPGGDENYIAYNTVVNNPTYGILVVGNLDAHLWMASGNVVEHNHVSGSGIADLALAAPSGAGNCFSDNQAATTLPPLLEVTHACGSPWTLNGGGDMSITERLFAAFLNAAGPGFHARDYRTVPAPPPQPSMPDVTAGPGPIFTEPFTPDDTLNGTLPAAVTVGGPAMLEPLGFTGYSIVQILLSLYGNLLLFALYAAWLAVAFVELAHRTELSGGKRLGWGALLVGVPLVGPIVYYFAGGSKLSRRFRLGLVVGAPLLCLAGTALLLVVASFTL